MRASSLFTYDKVKLVPQKRQIYGTQRFLLIFIWKIPSNVRNIKIAADLLAKRVVVIDEEKSVLTLVGRGSFEEIDFINADGTCIGTGSYTKLPNMSTPLSFGLNRTYDIYKDDRQNRIAHFHQVNQSQTCKHILLVVKQTEIDCLTKTLLVGKLIMMALLDPGFLHFQPDLSDNQECVTMVASNHILPNFILPDWDYPANLKMRIIGSIVGGNNKKDYYALFDPLGKPWYIMETNNSTELKVLDPVTYQPLLIGDSAVRGEELCTVTTPDSTIIGKIEGHKLFINLDSGFRKVYKLSMVADTTIAIFNCSGDSRYRQGAIISKCNENPTDEKEIPIKIDFPTHRLGLAVLLPAFCIVASEQYQKANVQAPICQNMDELLLRLENVKL